jgi:hypothetical protein
MSESTIRARADRSRLKTLSIPSWKHLWLNLEVTGRLFAPQGRTVRRSTYPPHRKQQSFYPRIFNRWRIVRPQGLDGLRYNLEENPEPKTVLFELKQEPMDYLLPSSGLSAGSFPAKPIIGKTLITFNSFNQIRCGLYGKLIQMTTQPN